MFTYTHNWTCLLLKQNHLIVLISTVHSIFCTDNSICLSVNLASEFIIRKDFCFCRNGKHLKLITKITGSSLVRIMLCKARVDHWFSKSSSENIFENVPKSKLIWNIYWIEFYVFSGQVLLIKRCASKWKQKKIIAISKFDGPLY